MTSPSSEAIPFVILSDGRKCLTGEQLRQYPELQAFVDRFPKCFYPCVDRDVMIFDEERREDIISGELKKKKEA